MQNARIKRLRVLDSGVRHEASQLGGHLTDPFCRRTFSAIFQIRNQMAAYPTAFAPRESALYDILTEIIHALEICPQILFYVNEADKGMKMDRLYRELLQLPLEDIKMVAESAYKVRRWLDNQDADSEKA